MENALDADGNRLLKLLVEVLPSVVANDPSTFITYKEAHLRLRLKIQFSNAGISLQKQGLNSLAHWAKSLNLPAIEGLIVREDSRQPGKGFFDLYGKDE